MNWYTLMALEFVYAPTLRALRNNSGPKGHLRMDPKDGRGPFGVMVYPRPLTKNEIENWALATIDMPHVNYYVYGVAENGNQELLLTWKREMPGAYDAAVIRAEELGRSEEFVDYVVAPSP